MARLPALPKKFRGLVKPATIIYPLIVIIAIPLLLAANTFWNLRGFNRDVNFILRHQAVSVADTIKPFIVQSIETDTAVSPILHQVTNSNGDIISATLIDAGGDELRVVDTTHPGEANSIKDLELNKLAIALEEPIAGLSYDPFSEKNVWNVVVPLDDSQSTLLVLKMSTDVVNEILTRTSRDSFIVLSVLIVVTLILLANHFLFYRKAQRARQLAELDALKDEFISMASHELRTPITAITGYLDLMNDRIKSEGLTSLKPDMDTLLLVTDDLKNLINDLLEVSRIEQGRLNVTLSDTQVNDIITKVVNTMKPLVDKKGLAIKYTTVDTPLIKTDPDRLRQVMTNLVSNSIKYTLKGRIDIKVEAKQKNIEVTVNDTGIGIPPEELSKLFSKFHRVKDKQTVEVRGTGLGLWITKQIVESLGGKIYIESIYGTGTRISFTLPLTSK